MIRPLRRWVVAGLCLTLLPIQAGAAPGHVFQPGDEIEVQILTSPDSLTGYNQRMVLSDEGVISLPHLGRITVSGRTADQILPDLNKRYKKLFAYAHIGLQLLKSKPLEPPPTEAVYVAGQVRSPGAIAPYEAGKRLSLSDLIGRAGGPTDQADLARVTIYRKQGTVETVHLERAMQDGSASRIELAPGETVQVPGNWLVALNTYTPVLQTVIGVIGTVALVIGLTSNASRPSVVAP